MNNLLLIFPLLYAFQVLKWCFSLKKDVKFKTAFPGNISWIVPFKNERNQLDAFFQSVSLQMRFPYEMILVDDGSEDHSAEVVKEWIPKLSFPVQLITLEGLGKKRAISQAIEMAKGEIVVCSDADCTFSPQFIEEISRPFSEERVVWVSGRVIFKSDGGFWKEVLASENEGFQAITAASIRANRPTMANGAAMAFRKKMFIEVGGYRGLEHVQSGDDELLLHRMWGKGDLVYAENAVVETHSVSSWKAFWKQRKRWVSKSGDYENRRMKVTMLVAWMARFSWILSLVLWNIVGVKFVILNSIFIVLPEIILLQRWGLSSNRAAVHLVIQAVYSLYVVVIPFLSRGIKNNDKKPPWIGL